MLNIYPILTELELQNERWMPIPAYETSYSVSDLGRVRSERRRHLAHGGILKPSGTGGPDARYPTVTLCVNAHHNTRTIHTLVMAAFVGPRPLGYHVNHKDNVPTNPRLANLEYITPEQNAFHAVQCGAYDSTIIGQQRRQTHCKYGHPLVSPNLDFKHGPKSNARLRRKRNCKTCRRRRDREYLLRKSRLTS